VQEAKIGADIVLEAKITRADGTVVDLGVISANKDALPEWFKELQKLDTYKSAEELGVIQNG
jgi:hypothetical protein